MTASPRSAKAELARAEASTARKQPPAQLAINKRIIDQELRIREAVLLRRLAVAWLVLGNLILIGLFIAGHVFIDYSRPGTGRGWLNFFGIVVILASLVFSAIATWLANEVLRGRRAELAKLKEEKKAALLASSVGQTATQRRYKEDVLSFIEEYRQESAGYRRVHNVLQSIIIVGSIVTTSVTSAIGQGLAFKWLAVAISITVGISAGFTGYFKFRERAMNLRQTADAIEHEYNAAELGIRRYRALNEQEALALLAEEVEWLRDEQRKREQQLEQPAEARSIQPQ
jgi:hypothetical protein